MWEEAMDDGVGEEAGCETFQKAIAHLDSEEESPRVVVSL